MALPGITNTALDNQLGVTQPATSTPHVIGVGSGATLALNTPTLVANQRHWLELTGNDRESPLADAVGYALDNAGGPVVVTRATAGVAAVMSAVAQSGAGPVITEDSPTNSPKNTYEVIVEITKAGALATSEYRYTLDNGANWTPSFVTAATIALGTSGISLDMAAGTYVLGERYSFTTTAPHFDATNLNTALTAAQLATATLDWDFYALAGQPATAAAGVLLFSALATFLNSESTGPDRYYRAMMNGGTNNAAATLTAYNAVNSTRILVAYLTGNAPAPFPVLGRGRATKMPLVNGVLARAAGNLMSTDLAQVAGAQSVGALVGFTSIEHNEFLAESGLDAAKITTARTYPNTTGFFLTNAWLKSAAGSDYEYWQHGRIIDEAMTVVAQQHTQLLHRNFEVKNDGTGSFTEASAQEIEKIVQRALDQVIGSGARDIGPTTISGKRGHVSEQRYQVDRTNNVLTTKTLQASWAAVPRAPLKNMNCTFSFALAV